MALNLCSSLFGVEILCPQVCADGFEVTNLISEDNNKRKLGFRVEYFIKPPVEIRIKMPVPVDIFAFFLELNKDNKYRVGGLELSTRRSDQRHLTSILRHFTEAKKLLVKNQTYRPKGELKLHQLPSWTKEETEGVGFRSFLLRNCYQIEEIEVKILKTLNSCVVALGCLEIWGQPARNEGAGLVKKLLGQASCEADARQKRFHFYDNGKDKEECLSSGAKTDENSSKKRHHNSAVDSPSDSNSLSIPAEFTDPITNEIMILPVLLPSGHNIDQTTLDKYNANESTWGRPPNDPFTALSFNSQRQPIPNTILKIRIDQFLSDNHQFMDQSQRPSKRIVGYQSFHGRKDLSSSRLLEVPNSNVPSGASSTADSACCVCNVVHDSSEQIYKLLCGHLICRKIWVNLLKNEKQISCAKCGEKVLTKDVIRVYCDTLQ